MAILFIGTSQWVSAVKATVFTSMTNFCETDLGTELLSLPHMALDGTVSL